MWLPILLEYLGLHLPKPITFVHIHGLFYGANNGEDHNASGVAAALLDNDISWYVLVRKQQRFSITEAIQSLPAKYRDVILYRHKDDKSYEEIADLLGIPVGTVKARIFRARELLKKKLKGI